MRFMLASLFLAALASAAFADSRGDTSPKDVRAVRKHLRDSTAFIRVPGSYTGTGSLVKRGDVTYVLTAQHVVGDSKLVKVVEVLFENDERVGEVAYLADVLHAHAGHDVAVLRVRKRGYGKASLVFYAGARSPPVDTEVLHCGNFHGELYSIVRAGHIDKVGFTLAAMPRAFDLADFTSFVGSSGGPVVLKSNGQYVGMLVRGPGETASLYTPIRRLRTWARENDFAWLFDYEVAVPKAHWPAWKIEHDLTAPKMPCAKD